MAKPETLERLPMTMGYFRLILRCFGDTSAHRAAILEGTGVTERELLSPNAEISLFQQIRQIENVARVFGGGWAFLRPEIWNATSHGALAVAFACAPTLAESLDVLRKYAHVRAPFYRLHFRKEGSNVKLYREMTVPLSETQERALVEVTSYSLLILLRAVLGHEAEGATYYFTTPRPRHIELLQRAMGKRLRFGQKENAVVIPASWLSVRSPFADPVLYRNAVEELERALERLERPKDLRARVVRLLQTMPDGRMSSPAAARALGVSTRTLVRRLGDADTNYRALYDDEMKRRATTLLRTGTLPRDAIAERLGYRDPTSFSRACRRWFGDRKSAVHRRRSGTR